MCHPVMRMHMTTEQVQDDVLRGKPLFCSRSRLCSHAKSLNRRMTSGCLFLYWGRSVWVHTLYDTYACKRRHWHSETSLVIVAPLRVSYTPPGLHETSTASIQEHSDSGAKVEELTDMLSPCLTGSRTVTSK